MRSFWSLSFVAFALLGQDPSNATPVPSANDAGHTAVYERSSTSRLQSLGCRSECNASNVRVRRNWLALSLPERKEYLDAVKCLLKKPSETPSSVSSGARNRMDDFTISHVQQTLHIHYTGWLLPWHRYFTWQFETALRDECGFTGGQPYWDWTASDDYDNHPLFDGSEYSLGGNGLAVPHGLVNKTIPGAPGRFIARPPGTGGGCVTDGAFANLTINLGPLFPYGDDDGTDLSSKPHCMTRDFLRPLAQTFLTTDSVNTLLAVKTMYELRLGMDQGVHFAGHASIGGDVADAFTSPQDPVFYFHHSQVDRLWTIWQEQDPAQRLFAVSDTSTWDNIPPSPNVTLADQLDFGFVGGKVTLSEVQDTMGGRMCYRYE